jgi:hypothetical protein
MNEEQEKCAYLGSFYSAVSETYNHIYDKKPELANHTHEMAKGFDNSLREDYGKSDIRTKILRDLSSRIGEMN